MADLASYDRVMNTLGKKRHRVDKFPCINSVSVATIDFMKSYDAYWPAAHNDPVKMAKLASVAHRKCGLDNVSLPFCMTVEAEVFGAPVNFFEDSVKWPSVKKFIAKEVSDLHFPKDLPSVGRIPVITKAIEILKREFDGIVPVNAYIVPPFTSLSSYLVETMDFLKWLIRSPENAKEFLTSTWKTYSEIAQIYNEAGADTITLHEMGASTDNISPKQFDTFVKPYLTKIISEVKCPTILNVCGSANLIVENMIRCGSAAIALGERTLIKEAREIVENSKKGYPIIGNVSSYEVLHNGPVTRIQEEVKKTIDAGVSIVAPGCDFWLETPTEHIKAFVEAVHQQEL